MSSEREATAGPAMWVPVRFPGQYYDEETDLVENWHRYYDASSSISAAG